MICSPCNVNGGHWAAISYSPNRQSKNPTLISTMPNAEVHTQRGTKIRNISAPTTINTMPATRVPLPDGLYR